MIKKKKIMEFLFYYAISTSSPQSTFFYPSLMISHYNHDNYLCVYKHDKLQNTKLKAIIKELALNFCIFQNFA